MSILSALLDLIGFSIADVWSKSLQKDYRNDPVYKRKLQELIERAKQFEAERDDKNS